MTHNKGIILQSRKLEGRELQGNKDFLRTLDFSVCSSILCFETGYYITQSSLDLDIYVRMT